MKLVNVNALTESYESKPWIRAISLQHWDSSDPLQTSHTRHHATRFNPGTKASVPFETLYLAEDSLVAQFEVGMLYGYPGAGGTIPNPKADFVFIGVETNLKMVADLSLHDQQTLLETSAQELTGDWRGYDTRSRYTTVTRPSGLAPTQMLAEALFLNGWEGFRTLSARISYSQTLILFPENMRTGSWLRFTDPKTGTVHQVTGTK